MSQQELIEFRNYVRQITSAKLNYNQEPKQSNPTKQLHFILKSTQLQQSVQKPNTSQLINRTSYDYLPRSSSLLFDSNQYKEQPNSICKNKTNIYVSVSELVKISNALNHMGSKEITALSSNYIHSLHELDHTIGTLLKRID